jgi:uncharacterized peroxidase-related enzyme
VSITWEVIASVAGKVDIEMATTPTRRSFMNLSSAVPGDKSSAGFPIFTQDTAPDGSRDALKRLQASVGVVPNLAATMAGSPALIQGFVNLREINGEASGLTAQERELLFLTNAAVNQCKYCQAVHSMFAGKAGVPPEVIDAVKRGEVLHDARMNALVTFGRSVVKSGARVEPAEVRAFLSAGFEKGHVLDVVACLAQSIMANYTNHIANVEFDEFLKPKETASV